MKLFSIICNKVRKTMNVKNVSLIYATFVTLSYVKWNNLDYEESSQLPTLHTFLVYMIFAYLLPTIIYSIWLMNNNGHQWLSLKRRNLFVSLVVLFAIVSTIWLYHTYPNLFLWYKNYICYHEGPEVGIPYDYQWCVGERTYNINPALQLFKWGIMLSHIPFILFAISYHWIQYKRTEFASDISNFVEFIKYSAIEIICLLVLLSIITIITINNDILQFFLFIYPVVIFLYISIFIAERRILRYHQEDRLHLTSRNKYRIFSLLRTLIVYSFFAITLLKANIVVVIPFIYMGAYALCGYYESTRRIHLPKLVYFFIILSWFGLILMHNLEDFDLGLKDSDSFWIIPGSIFIGSIFSLFIALLCYIFNKWKGVLYGFTLTFAFACVIPACLTIASFAEGVKTVLEEARDSTVVAEEYVDLGLPSRTKWKNFNETRFYTYTEAVKQFGDRLPTKEQWEELMNECTWSWTGRGYDVTGKNGNSIRMPAWGFRRSYTYGDVEDAESHGYYWSSTSTSNNSKNAWDLNAWYLYFDSNKPAMDSCDYYHLDSRGHLVRLVQD